MEVKTLPFPPVVEDPEVEEEEDLPVLEEEIPPEIAALEAVDEAAVLELVWFKKKFSINKLASGPLGSVYDPEELPPDHACPIPVTVTYCTRVAPFCLLA